MRHSRVDVLVDGHLFFDRPLHADQSDAELILEELADCPDATIPEVVDVIGAADILVQAHQVFDYPIKIVGAQRLLLDGNFRIELDIELESTDPGKIVPFRIEEHSVKQRACTLERGRVPWPHASIDFHQRFFCGGGLILTESVGQYAAAQLPVRKEHFDTRGLTAQS